MGETRFPPCSPFFLPSHRNARRAPAGQSPAPPANESALAADKAASHGYCGPADERLHLHHVQGRQVLRARSAGAREHLALVPAGREDRRARAERRRQVDGAADHGGHRGAVERRCRACAGRDRGPARAGAAPRSGQGRARQRRGRGARDARPARPLQRGLGSVRGTRRRLRRPARDAIEGAGADRPPRRLVAGRHARPRDGRAAAARRRPRCGHPLRGRAPPGRPLPPAALLSRPAAARRADEPPGRRVGRLARAVPGRLQGDGGGRHPRPVLPRQRRRLDPRARPRQGTAVRGQLLLVARPEAGAARDRGEDRVGSPPHARPRARMGADEPEGAARQVEGAPVRLRQAVRGRAGGQARQGRDPHPAGPTARRHRDRGRTASRRASATGCSSRT